MSRSEQYWPGAVQGCKASTLLTPSLMQAQVTATSQSLTKASMAMSIYSLRAMSKAGGGALYDDAFHAFWDPWRKQISQNMTTWCEDVVTLRSDCHAWSSTPHFEFMTEVAGVTPSAPSWKEVAFKPRTNLFSAFDARVPLGGELMPDVAHFSRKRECNTQVTVRLRYLPHNKVQVHITFSDSHVEVHVEQISH